MEISDRLKLIRDKFNLTQPAASARFGINLGTWKQYERGPSKPGSDALQGLAQGGININWLLTGEGEMLLADEIKGAQNKSINETPPVASQFALVGFYDVEASAGHGAFVDQELKTSDMAFRKDWLSHLGLKPDRCALITARGDSMEPTIYDGDLLLVDITIETIKDDSIYIVQTDHHLIVKRIQQGVDGSLIIISDNSRYEKHIIPPEQAKEVKIAGRVRWYGHEI